MILSLLASILISTNSVTFTAKATGISENAQLEFLFVSPNSDRDYEALFITEDSPEALAKAFEKANIPRGKPIDFSNFHFWPAGVEVSISPSFESLVKDIEKNTPPILFTGGARDKTGAIEAEKEMPSAIFALYGCAQSMLQLNDSLDQSATYGRFYPSKTFEKNSKHSFTISWNGKATTKDVTISFSSNTITNALQELKEKSQNFELNVTTSFDNSLTVKEAATIAQALALIDSPRVKINGTTDFYYRAFLPQEKWRERRERLAQPAEIYFKDSTFTVIEIKEDWSNEDELDPILTPVETICKNADEAATLVSKIGAKTKTAFFFAESSTPLEVIDRIRRAATGVSNWYVFY